MAYFYPSAQQPCYPLRLSPWRHHLLHLLSPDQARLCPFGRLLALILPLNESYECLSLFACCGPMVFLGQTLARSEALSFVSATGFARVPELTHRLCHPLYCVLLLTFRLRPEIGWKADVATTGAMNCLPMPVFVRMSSSYKCPAVRTRRKAL